MALVFQNLKGDNYFVKSKLTKTGKMTFFLTKTLDEKCLDILPYTYEVFEKYDSGMMFIRKAQPKQFSDNEMKIIESELKKNKSLMDSKIDTYGDEIKIYTVEQDEEMDRMENRLFGFNSYKMLKYRRYDERMKIKVSGTGDDRQFEVMRFCYRGSIDDWITIDVGDDLKALATHNLVHLGKDSFYELYRAY